MSSLGADRPFLTEEDFLSHIGRQVEVKLKAPVKGKKFYEGELVFYDGKIMRLKAGKETLTFEMSAVKKTSEAILFD